MTRLNEPKFTEVQRELKPFGLEIVGGSIEKEEGKAYISLNHKSEATFDKKKITHVIGEIFGVHTVVLDGESISF